MSKIFDSLEYLKDFIKNLYEYPGIYKMFDENKQLIYIGKAKNLQKRLFDYTNFSSLTNRIQEMVLRIRKIEILITKTESEALILEAQLIRSLKPKFNILLKTEKAYNFIFLNDEKYQNFPSFEILKTKNLQSLKISNKKVFGPFYSSFQMRQILDLIYLNFKIRNCSDSFFKDHSSKQRTCIQYDIGRCSGPCAEKINQSAYSENLLEALNFLKGDKKTLITNLEKKMNEASVNLDFESAIILRERLKALKNFYNEEYLGNQLNGDYIVFFYTENLVTIIKNRIFGGNNYGSSVYHFENISTKEEFSEVIKNFLVQLFLEIKPLNHVYSNILIENFSEILMTSEILEKTEMIVPLRGEKRKIIENLILNAKELSKLKLNKLKDNYDLIEKIKTWLKIDISKNIEKIEVFDNSHIMGHGAVGAVISFSVSSGFVKKDYRSYHIKSTNLPDDYQMLREVFFKRFPKHPLPDLLIIDGGLAHLRVAKSMIFEIFGKNFDDYEIISIAKGEKRNDGLETIFLKDESFVKTTHEDPKIHFLQRLRDEAHRFGIKKHKELRGKSVFRK